MWAGGWDGPEAGWAGLTCLASRRVAGWAGPEPSLRHVSMGGGGGGSGRGLGEGKRRFSLEKRSERPWPLWGRGELARGVLNLCVFGAMGDSILSRGG